MFQLFQLLMVFMTRHISRFEIPISCLKTLLKPDVALALHKCGVPWHIRLMLGQESKEVSVRGTIEGCSRALTIFLALSSVKESGACYGNESKLGWSRTYLYPLAE
jgi:hypothetical protein